MMMGPEPMSKIFWMSVRLGMPTGFREIVHVLPTPAPARVERKRAKRKRSGAKVNDWGIRAAVKGPGRIDRDGAFPVVRQRRVRALPILAVASMPGEGSTKAGCGPDRRW